MVEREKKRARLQAKYNAKLSSLRKQMRNPELDMEEREQLLKQIAALPRDASPVRKQRRCRITGRPHAVYRKFGLSRTQLREATMRGDVPGLKKASW